MHDPIQWGSLALAGVGLAALALAVLILAVTNRRARRRSLEAAETLRRARQEVEELKRTAVSEAKEDGLRILNEAYAECKERRAEIQRLERRILHKEDTLERRLEQSEKRERALTAKENGLEKQRQDLADLAQQQRAELERVGGISSDEARQLLMQRVEAESRQEAARLARQIEDDAREKAEQEARKIVGLAVQRCAVDHVSEGTVSVVPLPNDDMKGRIIGREGRNIRSFETLTGVDLIIDDTPEAVVISGFDPVRREVARTALAELVSDGRIHPRRIEETIEKARQQVEKTVREAGERAVLESGVVGVHPEVVRLLGKLKYRTSYGQNVLDHLVECAHLANVMAGELGADASLARRGALLHDIGKAADSEVEGSHVDIGIDLARRYGESEQVVNCIAAHHGDQEVPSLEAALVQAADAISASRPGARRETLEAYLKRVQHLEAIADACPGVEKAYAVQAGREVRIMVKPELLDDLATRQLAKDLAKKIEDAEGLQYPGLIKVTVIRETRAVEYAK